MTTAERILELMQTSPAPEELLPNPHPGEAIREDFLKPRGMTPYRLAKLMGVPVTRVDQILKGRRGINAASTGRSPSATTATTSRTWTASTGRCSTTSVSCRT